MAGTVQPVNDRYAMIRVGSAPRMRGWLVGALALCALVGGLEPGSARATGFTFTGREQTWAIPPGVTTVRVVAVGAPGGGLGGGLARIVQ